jgi:DNA repair protein RecN (Recombination protein N)
MLKELQIQNYALIRDLDIQFYTGLNTITGETGTGKSIMLGALGLILGNRADTSSLLEDSRKCIVEGKFDIRNYKLEGFFEANDIDFDAICILRREIAPNGKSRAFINDTPVNLSLIKELGEKLIDIHSQHQTIKLTNNSFQLSLLDAFAGHKNLLESYGAIYRQYQKQSQELEKLRAQQLQAQKENDYNTFQLNELEEAKLKEGELISLEEELNLLSNAENIQQSLSAALFAMMESEQSILIQIAEIRKYVSAIARLNPRIEHILNRIDALQVESKDIAGDIEDLNESVSIDNERMEEVSARLAMLNHLLNKHHFRNEAELISYQHELRIKVLSVENLADDIASLDKSRSQFAGELNALADKISSNRKAQVKPLEDSLATLLQQVGIPEAKIEIRLSETEKLTDTGRDQISILFSANKGIRPEPVSQVASGGELSRLMLCFKYLLADSIFLPTIIFDEIDTGISGEVTIMVGQIMKRLAANHQVISITHQPQVAAMGENQFVVYKTAGEDFSSTHIRELQKEERVLEIAKMISGKKPSALAMENAKELLKQ